MTSRQHRSIWTALAGLMFVLPLLCKSTVRGFHFTGVAAGNALQTLHTFVDPNVRHQIAQTFDENAEDHSDVDPSDPVKHFENQVRRIQRGEQIERLTILMSGDKSVLRPEQAGSEHSPNLRS
jgi:hypothetical protein